MAERLVPERKVPEGVIIEPEFLDEAALKAPSIALQQVRLELGRVGEITLGMLKDVGPAFKARDLAAFEDIARRDDQVDILETAILEYLGRIRMGMLTEKESDDFQGLMTATDNIENLADVIETDIVALAHRVVNLKSVSGEETRAMLTELYDSTVKAVELAVQSIRDNDQHAAESVMMLKSAFREQSDKLLGRKAARLSAEDPDYLALVRLQMGFVDQMRRIYTLSKRIAKVTLPPAIAQQA